MIEIPTGTQFGRNLQQLVEFASLALRGRTEFCMSQCDSAEAGDDGHQRSLLGGEGAGGARIDQNCSLAARSAERSGNQHAGRNYAAQRVWIAADREGDASPGGEGAV